MGLDLQQLRYDLALQATECRGRSQRFTSGPHGVDGYVCGEVDPSPHRGLEGATIPIGRERPADRTAFCGVPIVDHEGTPATFPHQSDQLRPCAIPGDTDLCALATGPPPVGPRKILTLQPRTRLLQAGVVDYKLPPTARKMGDHRAP